MSDNDWFVVGLVVFIIVTFWNHVEKERTRSRVIDFNRR